MDESSLNWLRSSAVNVCLMRDRARSGTPAAFPKSSRPVFRRIKLSSPQSVGSGTCSNGACSKPVCGACHASHRRRRPPQHSAVTVSAEFSKLASKISPTGAIVEFFREATNPPHSVAEVRFDRCQLAIMKADIRCWQLRN